MGHTSPSRSTNKEEHQVPDIFAEKEIHHIGCYNIVSKLAKPKQEAAEFMGDLEDIIVINEDDNDKDYSAAQWDLNVTDYCWDGFSSVNKGENSCGNDEDEDEDEEKKLSLNLSLNYQQVLDAWSDRGTPWAASSHSYMGEVPSMEEEEERTIRREASVMRYKEKRQMRLFSKKIRYQVRKLNADNRPRLKGRFVKKSS